MQPAISAHQLRAGQHMVTEAWQYTLRARRHVQHSKIWFEGHGRFSTHSMWAPKTNARNACARLHGVMLAPGKLAIDDCHKGRALQQDLVCTHLLLYASARLHNIACEQCMQPYLEIFAPRKAIVLCPGTKNSLVHAFQDARHHMSHPETAMCCSGCRALTLLMEQ